MRKIKKYIYPIVFSAFFILILVIIGLVLNAVLERGNYAGSAMIVLFIALWALIVAPIYCVKYCKIIYEEKTKLLFAFYNCLVLTFSHTFLFIFNEGAFIYCIIFAAWVACWTVLPLLLRRYSDRKL